MDGTLQPGRRAGDGGAQRRAPRERGHRSRIAYLVLAWLLVACVVVQVFIAGLATFVNAARWSWHENFVHLFDYVPLIMLVLAFTGRLPGRVRAGTALVLVLIVLQYVFANAFTGSDRSWLAALHTVNALAIFWLAVALGQWAWRAART